MAGMSVVGLRSSTSLHDMHAAPSQCSVSLGLGSRVLLGISKCRFARSRSLGFGSNLLDFYTHALLAPSYAYVRRLFTWRVYCTPREPDLGEEANGGLGTALGTSRSRNSFSTVSSPSLSARPGSDQELSKKKAGGWMACDISEEMAHQQSAYWLIENTAFAFRPDKRVCGQRGRGGTWNVRCWWSVWPKSR